ncbi:mannose-1-phosphate guanylyltransferase/mannose-6-phosphate isomerase [Campylobacter sp. 9BO]|uniref:mannose-1-phosphate guanylyltransferase/mannose-6-phosphate isomerase n=1 Tax=Campylobacter sp. 9BO TaxID=3424759 RepID=UPI003D342191
MTNIILCGGSGTRLWPLSRTFMPKQFIKLFDNKSLFEMTLKRNFQICKKTVVVSNSDQYFLALDQAQECGFANNISYILEPIGRNTAPAIALACLGLPKDDIVLITPSDHLIKNEKQYFECAKEARKFAEQDYLVTFGIKPKLAETGFGYIESDGENVIAFHEKPNMQTAEEYIKSGKHYWNSGIFMFKAGVYLDELEKFAPEILNTCILAYENIGKDAPLRIKINDMQKIPENSIDYAVMEKSQKVKVVVSDIDWSDLGSFDSLYDELAKDENGNAANAGYISINSHNNLVCASRQIATIDIDDLMIIDAKDALLISKKGSAQKVKNVVERLKILNPEICNIHPTASRPWGTYTVLESAPGYKIKRIEVKPGKRLSLQKHFHRNEHWIVISGTAVVTVGGETRLLRPNESTYIKMGEIHRLENNGKIPVVLIEAQVGEYTGEDDIVRIEDDFQR